MSQIAKSTLKTSMQWVIVIYKTSAVQNYQSCSHCYINTLRPRQYGRHFPDDVFKCIGVNENMSILITISLKFVCMVLINNTPSLVQIMAWCRSGDKQLSEPMMVRLLMHICLTRPQWINVYRNLVLSLYAIKCIQNTIKYVFNFINCQSWFKDGYVMPSCLYQVPAFYGYFGHYIIKC